MLINEILNDALYLDLDYPAQMPVIQIQNKTIATAENFICLNGLPKSYKTTFMFKFIESALSGNIVFDIKVNLKKTDTIIVVDTEQGKQEYYRQIKNLKKSLRINKLPDNFKSYLFRKYEPDVIIKSIYELVDLNRPKLLFIDNLTELVFNPNDMIESKKVIQFLKTITAQFNVVIVCLLHLGKQNLMSLGSLGSYADRGCQSSLKVVHDKESNITTMEATLMRSDLYFNPINITYDNDLKEFKQMDQIPKKENKRKFILMDLNDADHNNRIRIIFIKNDAIIYSELVEAIKGIYGVGTNIAKQQIIPYLVGNEFIETNKGIYKVNKNKNKN